MKNKHKFIAKISLLLAMVLVIVTAMLSTACATSPIDFPHLNDQNRWEEFLRDIDWVELLRDADLGELLTREDIEEILRDMDLVTSDMVLSAIRDNETAFIAMLTSNPALRAYIISLVQQYGVGSECDCDGSTPHLPEDLLRMLLRAELLSDPVIRDAYMAGNIDGAFIDHLVELMLERILQGGSWPF